MKSLAPSELVDLYRKVAEGNGPLLAFELGQCSPPSGAFGRRRRARHHGDPSDRQLSTRLSIERSSRPLGPAREDPAGVQSIPATTCYRYGDLRQRLPPWPFDLCSGGLRPAGSHVGAGRCRLLPYQLRAAILGEFALERRRPLTSTAPRNSSTCGAGSRPTGPSKLADKAKTTKYPHPHQGANRAPLDRVDLF